MPFRLWFCLGKVGSLVLFAIVIATFFIPPDSPLRLLRTIALGILIPLCLVGAVMGVLMHFGRLKMRCPFCGRSGPVGGSKREGMWLECALCGIVHSSGMLGLTIVRRRTDDDQPA